MINPHHKDGMNREAQRCKFRSIHRGLKELNYLLERFTVRMGDNIWEDKLYQELMECDDMYLWDVIMAYEEIALPSHLVSLVDEIRSIHVSPHA